MKIIYCSRRVLIDLLKDRPTRYTTSKIMTKFCEPKAIQRRELLSITNIVYLEYTEDLRLAQMYDSLMSKNVFVYNYEDLDHAEMFSEYRRFNEHMAKRISGIAEKDDLVVINDSSLFLIPGMVECRVAFRNLRFDHCFIERIPFYSEILTSLFRAQKFFKDLESLSSFNKYMLCSYEFAGAEKGGCWHLRPYVDKFAVIRTLEHFTHHIDSLEGKCRRDDEGIEDKTLAHIERLVVPKKSLVVLTNANLLHLESFITHNPSVHVRYLRSSAMYDEYTEKMIQYIKKTYGTNLDIVDITDYTQAIVEVVYCDVFVGTEYHEEARFLGKACVEDSAEYARLEKEIEKALRSGPEASGVIGEEEYVYELMRVNGYEIVRTHDLDEDKAIDQTYARVMDWVGSQDMGSTGKSKGAPRSSHRQGCITVCSGDGGELHYYKRLGSSDESELYIRRECAGRKRVESRSEVSEHPIIEGEGSFRELQNCRKAKDLAKIDTEKVREFWRKSNKTILVDYDGTLVGIVPDHRMAAPTPHLIELLLRINKEMRLVICTGRSMDTVDEWIPKEIEVVAEHGACHRKDGRWMSKKNPECLDQAREIAEYYEMRTPGTQIEEKSTGLAFHFSQAPGFNPARLYWLLRSMAGCCARLGKNIVEISSSRKDMACKEIDPAICIGDDVTDEDMFRVCNGVSIRVGRGRSCADGYLDNVEECLEFLSKLNE